MSKKIECDKANENVKYRDLGKRFELLGEGSGVLRELNFIFLY